MYLSRGKVRRKANFFVDYFCYFLQLTGVLVWELHKNLSLPPPLRVIHLIDAGRRKARRHEERQCLFFGIVFFPLIWMQDGGLELFDLFGRGRAELTSRPVFWGGLVG